MEKKLQLLRKLVRHLGEQRYRGLNTYDALCELLDSHIEDGVINSSDLPEIYKMYIAPAGIVLSDNSFKAQVAKLRALVTPEGKEAAKKRAMRRREWELGTFDEFVRYLKAQRHRSFAGYSNLCEIMRNGFERGIVTMEDLPEMYAAYLNGQQSTKRSRELQIAKLKRAMRDFAAK